MVKLTSPLMSMKASGQFGKNLTFQARGNKNLCRRFHYPKKAPTGKQLSQRYLVGLLTARWQVMSASEQSTWNLSAKQYQEKTGKPMTGFNYWLKTAQSDLYTYYGMIGFWPMNENSGRVSYDMSGNNFDINFLPASPAQTLSFSDSENDKFYKCISANGTNGYGLISYNSKMNVSQNFTCFFWVKFNAKNLIEKRIINRVGVVLISQLSDNAIAFYLYLNGSARGVFIVAGKYVPGVWYPIFCTYDGSLSSAQMKIFLTSRYVSTRTISGTISSNTNPIYFLSTQTGAYKFNGMIDNLVILNRTMPFSEIQKVETIMHSNKERQQLP